MLQKIKSYTYAKPFCRCCEAECSNPTRLPLDFTVKEITKKNVRNECPCDARITAVELPKPVFCHPIVSQNNFVQITNRHTYIQYSFLESKTLRDCLFVVYKFSMQSIVLILLNAVTTFFIR